MRLPALRFSLAQLLLMVSLAALLLASASTFRQRATTSGVWQVTDVDTSPDGRLLAVAAAPYDFREGRQSAPTRDGSASMTTARPWPANANQCTYRSLPGRYSLSLRPE